MSKRVIDIDFLQFQKHLKIKKQSGVVLIFDPIRNHYYVQTPEEIVRQLVLQFLIEEKKYNKNRIAVERMLKVNELSKRFDILVYDQEMETHLLIECKAPPVAINQDTFRQVATYNQAFKVKYLMVTNGIQTFCCKMNYENNSFEFLSEVPFNATISS